MPHPKHAPCHRFAGPQASLPGSWPVWLGLRGEAALRVRLTNRDPKTTPVALRGTTQAASGQSAKWIVRRKAGATTLAAGAGEGPAGVRGIPRTFHRAAAGPRRSPQTITPERQMGAAPAPPLAEREAAPGNNRLPEPPAHDCAGQQVETVRNHHVQSRNALPRAPGQLSGCPSRLLGIPDLWQRPAAVPGQGRHRDRASPSRGACSRGILKACPGPVQARVDSSITQKRPSAHRNASRSRRCAPHTRRQ